MATDNVLIGMPAEELDTPALCVDLDLMEVNIAKIGQYARRAGVRVRPHTKTHKCPIIARKQCNWPQKLDHVLRWEN